MPRLVAGDRAKADLRAIAIYTYQNWGEAASLRYKNLIENAYHRISENPYLPSSKPLINAGGLRALALSSLRQNAAAMKVKQPRHIIYYRILDQDTVEILRILHDKMNYREALPKKSILLATHNIGKFREFSALFAEFGVECLSPGAFNLTEPEETGDSFRANAELKARAACLACNRPALADDTGLSVMALNGAPGIYSARWAHKTQDGKADFAPAMKKIHELMGAHPDRAAQFVCALSLAVPIATAHGIDCEFMTVEGVINGEICYPPRGDKGFGYDAIFIPEGMTQTFAECDEAVKNRLSHRAMALQSLKQHPRFTAWLNPVG